MNKKKGLIIGGIAAAVLVAVVLLLVFLPKGGSDAQNATIDEGVALSRSVDGDGLHQAQVETDKDGNIANNSYGTLMEYYPADIQSIHVENSKGTLDVLSQTPEGQATVYTVKGYEDYALQTGVPDKIASAAASLRFSKVATLDKSKGAEFGFDKPRSTVTVTYTDKTKAVIIVGSDAPKQAGTYIKFGTGDAVYVADTDTVSAFDLGLTDMMSLAVNDAADNTDNNQASEITISGAGFAKAITLVPNDDDNYTASYRMTAPAARMANEVESSLITGGIRGLYADAVKMVNPSDAQLQELGLATPYATLTAEYPDGTVELHASKPDADGKICLMTGGGSVVYTLAASKAAWSQTSFDKLCGEYVCNPKMTALTEMAVTANGKTTTFALETKESVTTDDKGNETTAEVTTVTSGGKDIEIGKFTEMYNNVALVPLADAKTDSGSTAALTITYTFADGGSDKVEFISDGDKYLAKLNGEVMGHSNKGDVTRAVNSISEVA